MTCVSTKFLHTYTHFPALPRTSSTLDKSRELCWNLPGDCHARKHTGVERKTYTAVENWRHGAIVPFRHEIRVGSAIFSIYSPISLAACRCWPGTDSRTPETEYLCLKERMQPDFLWYSFTWRSKTKSPWPQCPPLPPNTAPGMLTWFLLRSLSPFGRQRRGIYLYTNFPFGKEPTVLGDDFLLPLQGKTWDAGGVRKVIKWSGAKGGGRWKTDLAEKNNNNNKTEEEKRKSLNCWLGKDKDPSLLGRSQAHKAG